MLYLCCVKRSVALHSCCVDEVAALHADADCVVHYGCSCLSPVSRLPTRLVFARQTVDEAHLLATLLEARAGRAERHWS